MHVVPTDRVQMIPASLRILKWWDRVALETLSGMSLPGSSRFRLAISIFTIAIRPGSDRACITADSVTSFRSGWE